MVVCLSFSFRKTAAQPTATWFAAIGPPTKPEPPYLDAEIQPKSGAAFPSSTARNDKNSKLENSGVENSVFVFLN